MKLFDVRIDDAACFLIANIKEIYPHPLYQWFLTGVARPPEGREEIFRGTRALICSTTWKVFERECAPSKRYASAELTSLHVIWFTSGRDGSVC